MSAAVEVQPHDEMLAAAPPVLLRQQAAAVLAAHRSRRQRSAHGVQDSQQLALSTALPSRSQSIASRVTERYAQTQSYRAFLAEEAEEATQKAKAAAEVAARTAQAVAAAQKELLEELVYADRNFSDARSVAPEIVESEQHFDANLFPASIDLFQEPPAGVAKVSRADLTVKLFEGVGSVLRNPSQNTPIPSLRRIGDTFDTDEALALDEEISFRQAPSFDLERSSEPIAGNLLEFPRQLVAARKARPRYAEGPLCEESEQGDGDAQLRIFEVDASQITSAHPTEALAPEWSSIWLDALTKDAPAEIVESTTEAAMPRPEAAPLECRVMASIVDLCLVSMGFVAFATAFASYVPVLPSLPTATLASAGTMIGLSVLYQLLFFTLSNATPGMRYARIGLCTFEEENPTHAAMLKRIPATLLAACPFGLGFLWACLDDDGLCWHDRLSGMYQRNY